MIKCDSSKCRHYFHVRCAISKGHIVDWSSMEKRNDKIYCSEHDKFAKMVKKSENSQTESENELEEVYPNKRQKKSNHESDTVTVRSSSNQQELV